MKILWISFCLISSLFLGNTLNAQIQQEPFELRVYGKGYFAVELRDGSMAYARNLFVKFNEYGQMVTEDDFKIIPSILVNTSAVIRRIDEDGTVSALLPGPINWTVEGLLSLYRFEDASKLKSIGAGLYRETKPSGPAIAGTAGNSGLGMIRLR